MRFFARLIAALAWLSWSHPVAAMEPVALELVLAVDCSSSVSPADLELQMLGIAERNPAKFGLLTPGTDIRICPEDEMRAAHPDYLIVLPWHFIDEFVERERDYLRAGGKLVVPMPEFRIHELCEETR